MNSSDLAFLGIGFVLSAIGIVYLFISKRERDLYKLYGIAINNFELIDYEGICYLLNKLWDKGLFSEKEYNKIRDHFKSCHPSENSKYFSFSKHPSFGGFIWWWKCDNLGKEQRLLFLKQLQKDCK